MKPFLSSSKKSPCHRSWSLQTQHIQVHGTRWVASECAKRIGQFHNKIHFLLLLKCHWNHRRSPVNAEKQMLNSSSKTIKRTSKSESLQSWKNSGAILQLLEKMIWNSYMDQSNSCLICQIAFYDKTNGFRDKRRSTLVLPQLHQGFHTISHNSPVPKKGCHRMIPCSYIFINDWKRSCSTCSKMCRSYHTRMTRSYSWTLCRRFFFSMRTVKNYL